MGSQFEVQNAYSAYTWLVSSLALCVCDGAVHHTIRAYKYEIKLNFGVQHGVLLDYLIRF